MASGMHSRGQWTVASSAHANVQQDRYDVHLRAYEALTHIMYGVLHSCCIAASQ
jgi:hypothetical protein